MRSRRQLPFDALKPYLLALPDTPCPLDGPAIFGNDRPWEVEVGSGKGAFLVDRALKHVDRNFLGIELDKGLLLYVATRMAKRSLKHVRLLGGDATAFLRDYVAASAVAALHLYYPDPWWKRRHHKRRIFNSEFAQQCERVLRPEGRLYLASDVEEYFQEMKQTLQKTTQLELCTDMPPLEVVTNFERKAKKQARDVWQATYRKPLSPLTFQYETRD